MTVGTLMTADELLQFPDDGSRHELVRGELRKMSPSGYRHIRISARIIVSLSNFVDPRKLGDVGSSEGGFRLSRNPDTVLAPDVAFVRAERSIDTDGFFEGPPDIAFEVVSPNDRYSELHEKTLAYLHAGTQAVVIVDPKTRSVVIHRSSGTTDINEILELPDLLPGWQLPLADLFA